jgi:acyl-CoA thioester hydrolase
VRKAGVIAAEIEFDVAFHDVDMVGVVWHGHYLRYFENARWALMEKLGYGFEAMVESGYAWPIVDIQAKYLHAARFGDKLQARAGLVEWENRLVVDYLITRPRDSVRIARARTVQVAVDGRNGELQFACPEAFVRAVREAIRS